MKTLYNKYYLCWFGKHDYKFDSDKISIYKKCVRCGTYKRLTYKPNIFYLYIKPTVGWG